MKTLWKVSPWISRLIIFAVACLFTMIGVKFVFDPLRAAADSGITVQSAIGVTNTRAGFGGFPLGFATILVFCLFSSRWLLPAQASIATVAALILGVRLFGAAEDATWGQSAHLLIPEAVIFVAALLGAAMEGGRRYYVASA
jgi:hypothetical protein